MRVLLLFMCGCSLYFGTNHSSHGEDASVDTAFISDAGPPPNILARPCIRAIATGTFLLGGADDIFLTYVCDANGAGGIIEYDDWVNGALVAGMARADWPQPFINARVVDADGVLPQEVLSIEQYTPNGWIFENGGGFSYESTRAFSDAYMGNIDGIAPNDLLLAGDNAIRVQHGMFSTSEDELLNGLPFARFAVLQLGTSPADLFFIAGTPGQPLSLGTAMQTAQNPLAYTMGTVAADPPGPMLPLVVADIDGDHLPDVIGGTSHIFVRSSKTGSLSFLEEAPAAIAAGDLDGDGVSDIVYITADHSAIRRVSVSATGVLASQPLLARSADAVVIGNLDGDHKGDLAVIHDLGLPTSTLEVFLDPM